MERNIQLKWFSYGNMNKHTFDISKMIHPVDVLDSIGR
jgi:hypothetical protein